MKKIIITILPLMIVLTCISAAWAGEATVSVSPGRVDIGANFNGAELTVTGEAPEGSDIYVKVSSPDDSVLQLSKKGKVGLFWLNVENTVVTNIPKLYQLISSGSLDRLPSGNELEINRDFSQVYSKAVVVKHTEDGPVRLPREDADKYVSALIDIYKNNGLYSVRENAVAVENGKFRANIILPPGVPQEKCSVTVYAVKDGRLVGTATVPFKVSATGVVRWLSGEAIYSGPEYGFIAVMTALAFGTVVALLFTYIEGALSGGRKNGLSPGAGH
jgi:hypothetical protein